MGLLLRPLVALLLAFVLFGAIERRWPARRKPALRAGWATDVAYWFLTPLIFKKLGVVVAVLVAAGVALAHGVRPDRASLDAWLAGRAIARGWPLWSQFVVALLLGDLVGYWVHRATHRGWLWRIHAVHHASQELDWLASIRHHPLNTALRVGAQTFVLLGLGFDPRGVAVVLPFLPLYGLLLHANVPWTFGPLRHVLASPTFHRWHHTSEAEGLDKNFAGLFPVWDLIFGTFYLPEGRQPQSFGAPGAEVPPHLLGQLLHPFRSRPTGSR